MYAQTNMKISFHPKKGKSTYNPPPSKLFYRLYRIVAHARGEVPISLVQKRLNSSFDDLLPGKIILKRRETYLYKTAILRKVKKGESVRNWNLKGLKMRAYAFVLEANVVKYSISKLMFRFCLFLLIIFSWHCLVSKICWTPPALTSMSWGSYHSWYGWGLIWGLPATGSITINFMRQ